MRWGFSQRPSKARTSRGPGFRSGLWKVPGGDLVVGFKKIASSYADSGDVSHVKLTVGQGELVLIRSRDGGRSWDPSTQQSVFRLNTTVEEISAQGPPDYSLGGSWDLGYPRVIEHEDGKLLAVYYMNLKTDRVQMGGGVRHIAQTVFTPD